MKKAENKYHLSFHIGEKMNTEIRKLAYKDNILKAAEARKLINIGIKIRKEETK